MNSPQQPVKTAKFFAHAFAGFKLLQAIYTRWRCAACSMSFLHLGAMLGHGSSYKQQQPHDTGFRQCEGCGRIHLPGAETVVVGWGTLAPLGAEEEGAAWGA